MKPSEWRRRAKMRPPFQAMPSAGSSTARSGILGRDPGGARGRDCAGETLTVSFRTGKSSPRSECRARGHPSEAEDGVCTIVLSCEREPQEVTQPCAARARISFLLLYRPARAEAGALYGRWAGGRLCARGRAPLEAGGDPLCVRRRLRCRAGSVQHGKPLAGDDIILTSG